FRDADAIFGFIPLPIGAFRIHESQKTSASITDIGHQEMNRIRKRVLGAVPNQNEIYKATMPFLLRHVDADKIFAARHRFGRS
ncbi:MAG: hypothetical protein RLP12_14030, partial [Ekhidna sp.]